MTAIPNLTSPASVAYVVPARASARPPLGLVGKCRVVRSRGRRAGAAENLVAELLTERVEAVVVPSLSALHPSPVRALAILSALRSSGVTVTSTAEPWVASADPSTVSAMAGFLVAAEKQRASRQGAEVIARLSRTGRPIGRPRKSLPCSVEEARAVVEKRGYRVAGQLLGLSASTVRRALTVAAKTNKGGAP